MAMSNAEERFLDDMVADPNVDFTASDREALAAGGIPIFCLLKCAAQMVACGGPTNPECIARFVACIAACRQ